MVPEFQKPQVTEIHVRMDCNGCVQKIKKALYGVDGIYDLYIDFPQQKITIIGWTDPEKIIKAIKKTRKMATICNIEPNDEPPSQPAEPPSQPAEPSSQQTEQEEPEGNSQAPQSTQPQPQEVPPAQAEPSKATAPTPEENNPRQQFQLPSSPRVEDVGEVHVTHQNPPNYGIGNRFGSGNFDIYHNRPVFLQEPPQPIYVTHSYNTYRTIPYVTEYEYVRSPPRYTHYSRMEHYNGDYQNGNGNITSFFSDENPNACRIV